MLTTNNEPQTGILSASHPGLKDDRDGDVAKVRRPCSGWRVVLLNDQDAGKNGGAAKPELHPKLDLPVADDAQHLGLGCETPTCTQEDLENAFQRRQPQHQLHHTHTGDDHSNRSLDVLHTQEFCTMDELERHPAAPTGKTALSAGKDDAAVAASSRAER